MSTSPQQRLEEERTKCLSDFTPLLGYYTLGNSHGLSNGTPSLGKQPPQPCGRSSASDDADCATKTATAIASERIKKDSGVGGVGIAGTSVAGVSVERRNSGSTGAQVCRYLHRDDDDPIGGAICSFPSMEIELPIPEPQQSDKNNMGGQSPPPPVASIGGDRDENGGDPVNQFDHLVSPVPSIVGGYEDAGNSIPVTNESTTMSGMNVSHPPTPQVPVMAASIMGLVSTPATTTTATTVPSFPDPDPDPFGLSLITNHINKTESTSLPNAIDPNAMPPTNDNAEPSTDPTDKTPTTPDDKSQKNVASSLATPTIWTRSSVPQAPPALLRSLSSSFSALVDSRVRAWTLFLLRHSLSSGEKESRSHLLNLLATRSSIEIIAAVTAFEVLGDGEMEGFREELRKKRECRMEDGRGKKKGRRTEDCDVVVPIRFEAVMDVSLQGKQLTIRFSAPGTIAATYHEDTTLITYVLCELDTEKLAASMVEQTRRVVFEAVAKATSTSSTDKNNISTTPLSQAGRSPASTPATSYSKLGAAMAASTNNMSTLGRTVSFATKSQSQNIALELQRRRQQDPQRLQQDPQRLQQVPQRLQQYRRPDGEDMDMDQRIMITTESRVRVAKSALKLSSLLTSRLDLPSATDGGGGDDQILPRLGKKKSVSVVWKHDDEMTGKKTDDGKSKYSSSLFKRRKFGPEQPTMKRSIKSFGRPDANDFSSVRNATFAEFGCMNDRDAGGHLRRPDALQRAQMHEQTFGLRRSGGSNRAVSVEKGRGGMTGAGASLNHMNATFERGMNSPLSMSNNNNANHQMSGSVSAMRGLQRQQLPGMGVGNGGLQRQQLPGMGVGNGGQKLPTGALGALSLSTLRSQKSAQFERMLSMMQNQGGSNK